MGSEAFYTGPSPTSSTIAAAVARGANHDWLIVLTGNADRSAAQRQLASAASVKALVRVLFGDVYPVGRLPVAINAANDPARVLYAFGHGLGYP